MAWLLAGVVEPEDPNHSHRREEEEEADPESENAMAKSTSGPITSNDAIAGAALAQNLTMKKRAASFLRQLLITVRGAGDLLLTADSGRAIGTKTREGAVPPFPPPARLPFSQFAFV